MSLRYYNLTFIVGNQSLKDYNKGNKSSKQLIRSLIMRYEKAYITPVNHKVSSILVDKIRSETLAVYLLSQCLESLFHQFLEKLYTNIFITSNTQNTLEHPLYRF